MTAPDPGLTDLIAAHRLKQSYWNWWGCTGCDWRTKGTYGSEPTIETATEHAKHVVEQHTNGRHEWPKTTPTGFTYERPTTYAELEHMSGHMVQSEIEGWEVAERPPEPVWELVGIAQQEVQRQRDRAEKAEATVARVEDAVAGLPACDKYGPDDVISCGWKRAVAGVRAALEGEQQ